MKLKTVGMLAGVTMMLTSVTVWSVTPPGGFKDKVWEHVESSGWGSGDPTAALESWRFESRSTLTVEGRLGHKTLSSSRDSDTFLFLNVKAPTEAVGSTSAPLNLAIAIDRSGSMSGKKLENAIEGARGMVRRLRDGDMVSVATFNTAVQTLAPPTVIDSRSREEVIRRIEGVTAEGDTCISCGLENGMAALRGGRAGMIKRMLLLSDGEPTSGVRDVEGFRTLAERARDMDCTISSVGVDVQYNEVLMSAIAITSNGRHYFVENPSGLPTVFDQEIQSLVKTVAASAEMRIGLAPGVQVLEVLDRAFRREGDELVVPMGSFAAGEEKTVLAKVRVPRGSSGMRSVADVRFTFSDLLKNTQGVGVGQLSASLTDDDSKVSDLDPIVAGRLGRAETASALREANQLFKNGDVAGARAKLADARTAANQARAKFAPRASAPRREALNRDFDKQVAGLDEAEEGFASAPAAKPGAAPAPPQDSRRGRAQVRANESSAAEFGF
jgi:Ca-activated chloride channel family protein